MLSNIIAVIVLSNIIAVVELMYNTAYAFLVPS